MDLKELAAQKAIEYVHNGMVLGLGTGSTTKYFTQKLGEKLNLGELQEIKCVPTSEKTAELARQLGIPLTTLADHPQLDLAVDGADEIDGNLDLIKGLGKALLREKVVESHAREFIIIADESKMVPRLGSRVPLPVEIIQFEAYAHVRWLNTLGCKAVLWVGEDGEPLVTDNGNFLVRCYFDESPHGGIEQPTDLARKLADRPGIVEHGLFLGMATRAILAGIQGIKVVERK